MKLPAALLKQQFPSKLVRGAVIRFEYHGFVDPAKKGPGPKFGVLLNRPGVTDPLYLVLTTSKTASYEIKQFDNVVLRINAGAYEFWGLPTVIPLRDNPVELLRATLEQQFVDGRLAFVGALTPEHLAELDAIIRHNPYIKP